MLSEEIILNSKAFRRLIEGYEKALKNLEILKK